MDLSKNMGEREAILQQELARVRTGGEIFALGEMDGSPKLVVFDLDGTLIPCEFVDEVAARRGLAHLTRELTERAMAGKMDFAESYKKRLEMLAGTPVALLDEVIEAIEPTAGAAEVVAELKAHGIVTAIVTGSYDGLGRAVQRRLGIDELCASQFEMRDGAMTGRVTRLVDEETKVLALRRLCETYGISTAEAAAVGDGANDLKMLAAAGRGIIYNARTPLGEIMKYLLYL